MISGFWSSSSPAVDVIEHALHLAGDPEEETAILVAEAEVEAL